MKSKVATQWVLMSFLLVLLISSSNVQARNEGVQVHGHWKLDIYNADGSFDRSVEFENSLTEHGARNLIRFLAREVSGNEWQVNIGGGNGITTEEPCNNSENNPSNCSIFEGASTMPNGFSGLATSTDSPSSPTKFILSGLFTVGASVSLPKSINKVTTYLGTCELAAAPNCGTNLGLYSFTSKILDTPISVQSGQSVQLSVEISFS